MGCTTLRRGNSMEQRIDRSAEMMNRLLAAIGKGNASGAERAKLEKHLLIVKNGFEEKWPRLTSAEAAQRKVLLRKFLKNTAERRKLRQQLGAEGEQEIKEAGQLRVLAGPVDDNEVREILMFTTFPEWIRKVENIEDQNIRFLIERTYENYHKGAIRIAAAEPFLTFLSVFNLWGSLQPMTDVWDALFDWLGVEQRNRPTDTGLRTIVNEHRREFADVDPNVFKDRIEEVSRLLKD